MPRVRSRKIGCWPIRSSYSSTRARISLMNARASRSKADRQVLGDAADLRVARVHAHAAGELDEVEHAVALAEAVEEQRDAAQVDRAGAEEDEVVVDALQLGEDRADPLAAARHLEAEQLLDRHAEHELVAEERVVVGPGRVRDRLPVRLLLHVLLDARVHVADLVVQADDRLAVERRDEAQHAVRRRVVRAEVEQHRVRVVRRRDQHRRDRREHLGGRVAERAVVGERAHQTSSENCTGSPPMG